MNKNAGLEAAVADGVIDRSTADRLAPYLTTAEPRADTADPDDEKLRLVTGFNDIFVTIGIVLFLGALGFLLRNSGPGVAGLAVAGAAWGLAEYFTRVKRLALPSIVLLVFFAGGVFFGLLTVQGYARWSDLTAQMALIAGFAAAVATALHWWRFHVPITIAAGAAALGAMLLALVSMAAPGLLTEHPLPVFLPLGLAVFALAMWFDSSDLKRQTRRTDIAFWLHLLAAPIIVHPLIWSLSGGTPYADALQIIAVFLVLAVVALVIDRRAILVSSLAYLAIAAGRLIDAASSGTASPAIPVLVVGAIVLMLSIGWRPLRRAFVGMLPEALRERVPVVS